MTIVWIIVIVVALVLLWVAFAFNSLVSLRNRAKEAWSDITVQTKRRYDLIPNLVKTVQGYAKHESKVFTEVTKARAEAIDAKGMGAKSKAENALTEALKSVFAVAENYPQLRASENFSKLQDDLTDSENRIEASRRYYNGSVRDLNTRIEVFPTNLIAQKLGFTQMELFDVSQSEKAAVEQAPKVDFEEKEEKNKQ